VTWESSDLETQLTRWPCSIMNSKYRLMCEEVFSSQRIFNNIGKSKSSLHGLTSSDFNPTTDTWQRLLSFQHFKCTSCILGIFSKTGKTWVSHRVKMMTRRPGDPDVKDDPNDPLTRRPNDPVQCLMWSFKLVSCCSKTVPETTKLNSGVLFEVVQYYLLFK